MAPTAPYIKIQRGPDEESKLQSDGIQSSCDCRSAVQVDDRQLLVLLSQLRLNSPQAKPQLQRVIYNLGQHHDTLRALLRLALALLRFPLSPDEAEPASEEEQSSAPRSLRDALQVSMPVYFVRMTSSHLHALPLCCSIFLQRFMHGDNTSIFS